MAKCRPHRWNVEDWLPGYNDSQPLEHDRIHCVTCGRALSVVGLRPEIGPASLTE